MDSTEGPNFFVPMSNVTGMVRSPFEYPQYYLAERWIFYLLAVYVFFLIVIGFPVNCLAIYITFHYHKLRTPINYIMLNLVVADLFMVVGGFPIAVFTALQGQFIFGFPGCNIEGFFICAGAAASIWSMVVLAFERWVKVCRPFKKFRFGRYPSIWGVIFIWLLAFGCAVPPLLGWSRYIPQGLQCSCGVDYYTMKPHIRNESFILYLFTIHFAVPSTVICFFVPQLLCSINKTVEGQSDAARQAEWEITRTVLAMIVAFYVLWGPYAWVCWQIYTQHGAIFGPLLVTAISFWAKSSSIHYPFIYVCMNRQFRDCFIRTLCQGKNPFEQKGSSVSASDTTSDSPVPSESDPDSE